MRLPLLAVAVAVLASVLVFAFLSPLLGAVMMIGAVASLLVTVVPLAIETVARWLSVGLRR